MKLGPRLNQSSLPSRQAAGHWLDRVQANYRHIVLVVRVEVG